MIPYGRQNIDDDDIKAVCNVLRSDLITTGPMVEEFERQVAKITQTEYGAALNSGTAALHAVMHAIDIKPGDEVIVPPMTFVATANAVVYQGGTPVFSDVDPDTLLIDPEKVEEKITSKTRAIVAVDYAGQMCDYEKLGKIALDNNIYLIADACHSLGGEFKGAASGSYADFSVFSFHPVKPITTGEGGMVVSNNCKLIQKIKKFRNNGMETDCHDGSRTMSWHYEISHLGFNYRLTDLQCALGISQLNRLPLWVRKRNLIAEKYDLFFKDIDGIDPLKKLDHIKHAYHLYVIRFRYENLIKNREKIFSSLRRAGIGVNVHYIPVHYHLFYKKKFNTGKGLCPVAEKAYEEILTLPLFADMKDEEINKVCSTIRKIINKYYL